MEEKEAAKTLLKPKSHTWKQKLKTGHYAKRENFCLYSLALENNHPEKSVSKFRFIKDNATLHKKHRKLWQGESLRKRDVERETESDREMMRERERERTKSRRQFEGLHFQVVDAAHPDCQILTTADLFLCSICWMTLLRRNRFRLFLHSHGLGMATFSDQETEISKSFNSWWTHTIVNTFLGNLDRSKNARNAKNALRHSANSRKTKKKEKRHRIQSVRASFAFRRAWKIRRAESAILWTLGGYL